MSGWEGGGERPKDGAHLWVLEKNSPAAAAAAMELSAPFLEPPQSSEGAQTLPFLELCYKLNSCWVRAVNGLGKPDL